MRIDVHVPITLRIVGSPTDDQLAAAGQALTRAVAARLAQAERLLADRHGHRGATSVEISEPYDPEREGAEGYAVPSFGHGGDPVVVPDRQGSPAPAPTRPTMAVGAATTAAPAPTAPAFPWIGKIHTPNNAAWRRDPVKLPDAPDENLTQESPFLGLTTATYAEIEALVDGVMTQPTGWIDSGRRAYAADPKKPPPSLLQTHFRNNKDAVSYARGYLEAKLSEDAHGADPEQARAALLDYLLDYAIRLRQGQVDIVIHTPATPTEILHANWLHEVHDERDFEAYLYEVRQLNEAADQRTVAGRGGWSGAAEIGPYEYFIGEPIKTFAQSLPQMDTRHMVSLMIDFVPIVGQLKAVAESIIGMDLVTGDELRTWQRGLGLLLSIIPEAKGIFSAGRAGLRILARVAVDTGKAAEDVYRAARLASRLTVREVQEAQHLAAQGVRATPAQRALATKLTGESGTQAASSVVDATAAVPAGPAGPAGPKVTRLAPMPDPPTYTAVPKVSNELPEGTHKITTSLKPRTAETSEAGILAENLARAHGARPLGHEAHHLVPKGDLRAAEARNILKDAEIGINDADNGAWLPKIDDDVIVNETTGMIHSKLHTDGYIKWITAELREAAKQSPQAVRLKLAEIQRLVLMAHAVR